MVGSSRSPLLAALFRRLLEHAVILAIVTLGLASCTGAQVPTDKWAYCEAQPTAILPDGTNCSKVIGRTGPQSDLPVRAGTMRDQ